MVVFQHKRSPYEGGFFKTVSVLLLSMLCIQTMQAADLKLWYTQPAQEWLESLPIGNGRLLATNQGGVHHEVIQLNEDTIWSGQPKDYNKVGGAQAFAKARQLVFEGEYKQADQLVNEKFLTAHSAHGVHTYQTLGDLNLFFDYGDRTLLPSEYRRELDLNTATSQVSYQIDGTTYTRELFSSSVDQAIVVKLSCDEQGKLSFDALFSRPNAKVEVTGANCLRVSGIATDLGNDQSGGVAYEAQIQVLNTGGALVTGVDRIRVEQADSVELRIVAATNYHGDEPNAVCEQQLSAIEGRDYDAILQDHIIEHQRLFHRVEMDLPQTTKVRRLGPYKAAEVPTDIRLQAFRQGLPDPELIALYFQFGRYLLISSSRPGTQAINLWGKWINTVDPFYNADYHTNINIQMNYWAAQIGNLAECHTPYLDLTAELREQGRASAEISYGINKGFVAHHATDGWRFTAAVGRAPHGMWVMTPTWGAHHMWLHYLYTGDREYLANTSYPVMREAAEFIAEYLVEHPKTGYLVTGPSTSPENSFIAPNGDRASLSMAPAMDMQLVEALFRCCIEASEVLDVDAEFRQQLKVMHARLQPSQIGKDGRLMEWSEAFKEVELGHKHVSHLWAVAEGDAINYIETPELAAAAHKSLDVRVEHGSAQTPVFRGNTGWIVQGYVRLWDGDAAYDVLRYLIAESSTPNLFALSVQGLARKMWETDANLGCTASIAEMFLQSHAGAVHLLPAMPAALHTGSIKGLRAQGGFEVDLDWANGTLISATIHSLNGEICRLRYGSEVIEFETIAGGDYHFNAELKRK